MGQYHVVVNLDRREYLSPHVFGAGLKALEQVGTLVSETLHLLISNPERRGGGDVENRLSNGRRNPALTPFLGRWRGCRIAMIGDYAEAGDLSGKDLPGRRPGDPPENLIYDLCQGEEAVEGYMPFSDISLICIRGLEVVKGGVFVPQVFGPGIVYEGSRYCSRTWHESSGFGRPRTSTLTFYRMKKASRRGLTLENEDTGELSRFPRAQFGKLPVIWEAPEAA